MGYDELEMERQLRELTKSKGDIKSELKALISILPSKETPSMNKLEKEILGLIYEREMLLEKIKEPQQFLNTSENIQFNKERQKSRDELIKKKREVTYLKTKLENLDFEIQDLKKFANYLQDNEHKIEKDEVFKRVIGAVNFEYCPACQQTLVQERGMQKCQLCKNEVSDDDRAENYAQIKEDLRLQISESKQLLKGKENDLRTCKGDFRKTQTEANNMQIEFDTKFEFSDSAYEKLLAEANQRIGEINSNLKFLEESKSSLLRYFELNKTLDELDGEIAPLKNRLEKNRQFADRQRRRSITSISQETIWFLHNDLERQQEFQEAKAANLDFGRDVINVDGRSNFAESSNVILKNSAYLGMLLAACDDDSFLHPKFLLMDNIEDKGMQPERSQNFQRLICERFVKVSSPFQIIFMTSMMNSDLEDYTVGPHYSHEQRTLKDSMG